MQDTVLKIQFLRLTVTWISTGCTHNGRTSRRNERLDGWLVNGQSFFFQICSFWLRSLTANSNVLFSPTLYNNKTDTHGEGKSSQGKGPFVSLDVEFVQSWTWSSAHFSIISSIPIVFDQVFLVDTKFKIKFNAAKNRSCSLCNIYTTTISIVNLIETLW